LAYDSRKLDPEGQSFVFRCETPGTYVLKFYKQDFIRDYILNDHVQVMVGEAPESAGIGLFNPPVDRGRVTAEPRWPPLDREREELSRENFPRAEQAEIEESSARTPPPEEAVSDDGVPEESPPPDKAGGTAPGPESGGDEGATEDKLEDSTPDGYVSRALEEYNAGRIPQALAVMDRFRQQFPSGTDEAWWLLGQLLEANSPARDIRLALEYYRRLVREFPQSQRVPAALRRIAYLERYYFNIQ
jgi:tetratricopeptide (TPR) repeat protein